MATNLEQLIENRRRMIDVLELNNSARGVQSLLTDLYPDSAHFVYELLQNAEDAKASRVEFRLAGDGVYFAHDGAREFTIEDVDAITGIGGNIGKRHDSSSIGEFGVGFKAVFSYTRAPEIHSGEFHFRIRDHFLIELDGVPQRFLRHHPEEHWTEFWLPFDNPSKTAAKAFAETRDGFTRLDETALLFLRNIARIDYQIGGAKIVVGGVERCEGERGRVELLRRLPDGRTVAKKFLRYIEDKTVTSSRGKTKRLPLAIAYGLETDSGGAEFVAPVDGKTCVYFPAEKEVSHLRFHINAPFSATVARDSIRDCCENDSLMADLAALVARSLHDLKARGLLGVSLYAVMPNDRDGLSRVYRPILDRVVEEFRDRDLVQDCQGGFISARNAIRGSKTFSDFLDAGLLADFAGMDARWAANPGLKSVARREYDFLDTLGIREYGEYDFARAFNKPTSRDCLLRAMSRMQTPGLKRAYQALYAVCSKYLRGDDAECGEEERERRAKAFSAFYTALKGSAIVRCADGRMYPANQSFVMPAGFSADDIHDPIADPKLFSDGASTKGYDVRAVREMLGGLGMREYGTDVILEKLVEKYSSLEHGQAAEIARSEEYYRDILTLAREHAHGIDVDVAGKPIFLGMMPDGKTRFLEADKLALGDAYDNDLGDEIAAFQGFARVHPVYTRKYRKQSDLADFVGYLRWAGVHTKLEIVESPIGNNPEYRRMSSLGGTCTAKGTATDFTVRGLPDSLSGVSRDLSLALWELLCSNGSTAKYAIAIYHPNARSAVQSADSQLIAFLKASAWLPDDLGEMHKPGEIAFQQLDHAFREMATGALVSALNIGSAISSKLEAESNLKAEAAKLGQHLISDEDYMFLQKAKEKELKEAQRRAEREAQKLGSQDLLDRQNRESRGGTEDLGPESSGAVRNPERRAQRIGDTIRDMENIPIRRRTRFSVVTDADKGERETLKAWYRGSCQICDNRIVRYDGEPYFEAINIISSSDLPDRFRASVSTGWNSLSLCPNCAAKYRYSNKKLSGFAEQVEAACVVPGDDAPIAISFELAGRTADIKFCPKHFIALREGLRRLDQGRADSEH